MFSDADKINIFQIIISVFLYQLFPAPFSQCSPQLEPHLSAGSSRWAQKPSLKQGCSVGFHLLRSGRPQHLPVPQQGSQYGQPGIPFHGRWWAAAHLLAPQPGRVHPGCPQARGGLTTSSSADRSGQGRRRMEWGREGVLLGAKCSTGHAASAGQAEP